MRRLIKLPDDKLPRLWTGTQLEYRFPLGMDFCIDHQQELWDCLIRNFPDREIRILITSHTVGSINDFGGYFPSPGQIMSRPIAIDTLNFQDMTPYRDHILETESVASVAECYDIIIVIASWFPFDFMRIMTYTKTLLVSPAGNYFVTSRDIPAFDVSGPRDCLRSPTSLVVRGKRMIGVAGTPHEYVYDHWRGYAGVFI